MNSVPRPRAILTVLFFTIFLDLVGFGIAIPVLAPLILGPFGIVPIGVPLEIRTIIYGFLVATFPLFQFFGAPILGALSDRYGRKKILLLSLTGTLIGYLFAGIGIIEHRLWLLFLSRAVDGFTGGNIVTAQSAIADVSDERSKARNFGLIGMAFGLGFILGPYIGGKLSDPTIVPWFSSSTPFWFAAVLSSINILLVRRNLPETLHTRIPSPLSLLTGFKNIARAFHIAHLRTIFIVTFLLTLGFNFFTQFFQVFLINRFTFAQGDIGDTFAYMGFWIAITQGLINRPLSRRFLPEQIVSFSALALGLVLPLLLVPEDAASLFLIHPLVAISNGLTHPNAVAIVSNLADRESQGEVLGINQSIQSFAMIVPPIIASFLATLHPHFPILAASITIIVAWVIFAWAFHGPCQQKFHEV
jgi:DHA1 family tetracycline resistance protein-like MFS transporter